MTVSGGTGKVTVGVRGVSSFRTCTFFILSFASPNCFSFVVHLFIFDAATDFCLRNRLTPYIFFTSTGSGTPATFSPNFLSLAITCGGEQSALM